MTGTDPKGEAGKFKPQLHLIPKVSLEEQSKALECGRSKYGFFNWRETQVGANTYISAMLRHIAAYKEGEDLDPESGASHLGHIMASCAILLDAAKCGTLVDDRVKPTSASNDSAKESNHP
jgi:hypothetical protein